MPKPSKANPYPTITIAAFLFDRRTSADALIAACRRGVGVRVILDGAVRNPTQRRLFRVLNADNVGVKKNGKLKDPKRGPCDTKLPKKKKKKKKASAGQSVRERPSIIKPSDIKKKPKSENPRWGKDRSYAKWCKGSCRGIPTGNMHSKFYLFSKSGKAKNVVMVSSSNLNAGGVKSGWNDLFVVNNRADLYKEFQAIHLAMTRETRASEQRVQFRSGPYLARFFPMQYRKKMKDPMMVDLNKIKCQSAFGPTQIYISMFYWKGKRGNKLATKVLNLARQGCQLNIIVGAPSNQILDRLKNAARNQGRVKVWDSRWNLLQRKEFHDGACVDRPEVRTHGKYIAVKGNYGGDKSAHVVMTGSSNWVGGTLTVGDEVSLNIETKAAYNAYLANWNAIRAKSKPVPLPYGWVNPHPPVIGIDLCT